MTQTQFNLYEILVSGPQELMRYHMEVKRGKNMYQFEIYRTCDTISVFYRDQSGRQQAIVNTEDMMTMLASEEDKKHYWNIIGDSEWVLVEGNKQQSMTKEEESAFVYLKKHVLDEMAAELGA